MILLFPVCIKERKNWDACEYYLLLFFCLLETLMLILMSTLIIAVAWHHPKCDIDLFLWET